MKRVFILICGVALILTTTILLKSSVQKYTNSSTNNPTRNSDQTTKGPQIFAQNLNIPWAIVFLPSGNMLITERVGKLDEIDKNGNIKTIFSPPDVNPVGEGRLMGITLDPNFSANNLFYMMYTYSGSKEKIVRYKYNNGKVAEDKVILDKIPAAQNHHGGRIKFGPDGFLYITTGDALNSASAQDKNSLNGKILRMTVDGQPAPGNPFGTLVYSYGHRNPEGLFWDSNGTLWETEHGNNATDEVNIIKPGENYGWPNVIGDQKKEGITSPVVTSGPNVTWAPANLIILNGKVYFAGLKSSAIFSFDISNPSKVSELYKGEYGRIRELTIGPDGNIYFTTSNRDGRGTINSGDDKIVKLASENLQ